MKRGIIIINLFMLIICINSNSCSDRGTETTEEKITYEIVDTTFVSQFVGDSIKLDISLPSSYNDSTGKIYPVVYLTDGYWRREEHSTIHQMSDNNEIPEVIVVGIGYPDGYDYNNIRVRDLITNANTFLLCIKNEIIPYIENKYMADTLIRTLWGSSYGGYFLIYSFTEHLNLGKLFKNYICASAALNPPYQHTDLLENEQTLWTNTKVLPVNLYLTVGGDETSSFINSYNGIVEAIESHPFVDLYFEHEIISSTNHYTVWKPTLLNGLRKFLN